jgi:hypothetical protein
MFSTRWRNCALRLNMAALCPVFPQRLISRYGDVNWPPRTHDLSTADFFMWVYPKAKMWETRPANILELKRRIWECTEATPNDLLRRVNTSASSYVTEQRRRWRSPAACYFQALMVTVNSALKCGCTLITLN